MLQHCDGAQLIYKMACPSLVEPTLALPKLRLVGARVTEG